MPCGGRAIPFGAKLDGCIGKLGGRSAMHRMVGARRLGHASIEGRETRQFAKGSSSTVKGFAAFVPYDDDRRVCGSQETKGKQNWARRRGSGWVVVGRPCSTPAVSVSLVMRRTVTRIVTSRKLIQMHTRCRDYTVMTDRPSTIII
jgi:hypothetical protein